MRKTLWTGGLLSLAAVASAAHPPARGAGRGDHRAGTRRAGSLGPRGPGGVLETYAPEVTYFDPFTAKRIDGLAAMRERYGPIQGMVKVTSYDMIDPKVQGAGDVRVLSYNLVSRSQAPTGDSVMTTRWNSSTVYTRIGGRWKICSILEQ